MARRGSRSGEVWDNSDNLNRDTSSRSSLDRLPRPVYDALISNVRATVRALVRTDSPLVQRPLVPQRRVMSAPVAFSPPVQPYRKPVVGFRPDVALREVKHASDCAKSQSRKEVLFSSGVAGKRGSAPGPYRKVPRNKC